MQFEFISAKLAIKRFTWVIIVVAGAGELVLSRLVVPAFCGYGEKKKKVKVGLAFAGKKVLFKSQETEHFRKELTSRAFFLRIWVKEKGFV